jgi:hypothetical protein
VSTELAIGSYPEPSQFPTFEVDFHNILILFSSTSLKGLHSFLLLPYCTSNLCCLSHGILLLYILYFITMAIIVTKENSDAIDFLDSPINSTILVSYIIWSTLFSNILSSCCS